MYHLTPQWNYGWKSGNRMSGAQSTIAAVDKNSIHPWSN